MEHVVRIDRKFIQFAIPVVDMDYCSRSAQTTGFLTYVVKARGQRKLTNVAVARDEAHQYKRSRSPTNYKVTNVVHR